MFLSGKKNPESWYMKNDNIDFYYLKSYVYNILKRICLDVNQITLKQIKPSYFSEGLTYFYNKLPLVEFGILDKDSLKPFDIKQEVFYADFLWDNLLKLAEGKIKYQEVPKFPEVRRDLALLINKDILFSQIEEIALQTEKKILQQIGLFDIYEGDKIDSNKKSYAVSFILQDENKTLTDKDIEKIMARFIKAFEEKLGAIIR
jgi:phenylalanyl-tRNA synthetase beta chain